MIAAALLVAQAATSPPAPLPEATVFAVRTAVSPEPFTLGDAVEWRVEIEHDPRDAVALEPPDFQGLVALAPPRLSRTRAGPHATTAIALRFADRATLAPRLPDLALRLDGPEGARALHVKGRELRLRSLVAEEGAPNAERAHHGPKPPAPVLVRSWLWALLLGGLVALVAAVVGIRSLLRARARRKLERAATPPTPEEEALARLAELRQKAPWKRGGARRAIFTRSEILRGYLGRRFGFGALDLTSAELLAHLGAAGAPGVDLARLSDDVQWEDVVKYARHEPSEEECLAALSRTEELVRSTRTAPVAAEPAQDARR